VKGEWKMKGTAASGIMLTLFLISMLTLASNTQPSETPPRAPIVGDDEPLETQSGTWIVDDDGPADFSSIQEAIDSSLVNDGDTIFVYNGTYYEHVTISKSISLIGENRSTTIIDGSRNGTTIFVIADCVNISGLTIQNGYHIPHVTYGIKVGEWNYGCSNVTINGNIISNNDQGIFFYYSNNGIVTNNIIFNNFRGISIVLSYSNYIAGNSLFNNEAGVAIGSHANSNVIRDNEICENSYCGVTVGWSSGNEIVGNTLSSNNIAGIRLGASSNNTIIRNTITSSTRDGIVLFGSNNNTIIMNELIRNKWDGIAVWYSNANVIYHNNFQNNTKQAGSYDGSTAIWDDGFPSGGNYWSDYTTGYPDAQELDDSGIWDTPYVVDGDDQDNYPLMEPWAPSLVLTTIRELKEQIEEFASEGEIDNQGIVNSLLAKLNVAQKLVDKGKMDEARSILEDDFIPQVRNLSGIHMTVEAVDVLVKSAEYIVSSL
jgi:parallel beta-helix repeat protein